MRFTFVLAVCLAGAATGGEPQGNRHRRSAGVYLSITGEKPQGKDNVPSPILPVQLPIQLGGKGGVTLPVLIIPVPVYTKSSDTCDAQHSGQPSEGDSGKLSQNPPSPPPRQPPYVAIRGGPSDPSSTGSQQSQHNAAQAISSFNQFNQELQDSQAAGLQRPVKNIFSEFTGNQGHSDQPGLLNPIQKLVSSQLIQSVLPSKGTFNVDPDKTQHTHNVAPSQGNINFNLGTGNHNITVHFGATPDSAVPSLSQAFGVDVSARAPEQDEIPYSDLIKPVFESSAEMVQSFIQQAPVSPELPAVIPEAVSPERLPPAAPDAEATPIGAAAPPVPRFSRSLQLRVDLTVPRADYTEAFQTEWHADSQTSRTVVEDGTTTFYRAPLPDGRVQFLEMRVDRSGERPVRRCTLSPLMAPSEADRSFPALPDMEQFQFTGYTSAEGKSQVERWQRTVTPGVGRGGAAEGEALTVHHEMLLTRHFGEPVPLRYTVVTDSSVLGPAADSYVQRYRAGRAPAAPARPDAARECDAVEELPEPDAADHGARADVVARFEPLREFTLPTRDKRYDSVFGKYKSQFQRNYLDVAEQAVRKTLLTHNSRFVAAGNRLASTFELAANFLADRLDEELELLFGVKQPPAGTSDDATLVPFPYSDEEVENISETLPDEFDWRPKGAVSPVRFQETTCASCWAFAVAGATEGALFKRTGRLVPLSPQCLVDCGRPFGTNGCQGTWPNFAYDYVQARGLPAWDEYTNYQAKVLECKDRSVPPVTHISGHVNVTANSVPALKVAIRKNGPNVVIVDAKAKSFILYSKGVLKDQRCGQNRPVLNHAVLAVGWGRRDGEHFILKNSWSAAWGEQGYVRVHPGSCALLQRPSYPIVADPNIDREELRAAAASLREEL